MDYRLGKQGLPDILRQWIHFLKRKVHFEDCLTLMRARRDQIDVGHLVAQYRELASYDVSQKCA